MKRLATALALALLAIVAADWAFAEVVNEGRREGR